ncbi:MAG: O-antigen ligase family protein, partial [Patescibacteria group bacterium]
GRGSGGKRIVFGAIIALMAVVGSLWIFRTSSFIQGNQTLSRLTDLSSSDINIAVRYQIWNMSWQGFKERPILGWGPENQTAVFFKYYQPEMREQQPWFDRSHNIILDWLISAGILGLLSYLSIFVFAIRTLNKNYRGKKIIFEEYILIIGIFVAYFFQNLFLFDNIATYIPFFAILAWIYSVSIQDERAELSPFGRPLVGRETDKAVAVMVLSVFFFYFYFINVKPYLANKNLFLAIANRNDLAAAFDYFKAADKENTFLGRDEIRAQFADFLRAAAREGIQLDESKNKQ